MPGFVDVLFLRTGSQLAALSRPLSGSGRTDAALTHQSLKYFTSRRLLLGRKRSAGHSQGAATFFGRWIAVLSRVDRPRRSLIQSTHVRPPCKKHPAEPTDV